MKNLQKKFKPKKTTDDCYTPPLIYKTVAGWVANKYGLNTANFVRPFYPDSDYKRFNYKNKIVVDNPPFSILMQIIRFYVERDIKFFMFAPTLTGLVSYSDYCTAIPIGITVTYENGANVSTSFVTNLEAFNIRMMTAPSLYEAVKNANKINIKRDKKEVPKYIYPTELVTAASMGTYNKYGINFVINRDESVRVSALDSQRVHKKSIFGGGLLISEREKVEREKAEREKAKREKTEKIITWKLSDNERKIIENLNKE